MVALNIPLLQFHFFKNLSNQLQGRCVNLIIRPSVSPGVSTDSYLKFVSSIYRIDFDAVSNSNSCGMHHTLYIFFRNKKSDDNSFTKPSSVELVKYSSTKTVVSLCKVHYFMSSNPPSVLNQPDEFFISYDVMKQGIVTISNALVSEFISSLQKVGFIV